MNEEIKKEGLFPDEQVDELKKKHGKIFVVEADDAVAYFRKPSRQEVSYAMTALNQNKMLEFIEAILKSCYVGGSKKFLDDVDYMLGAAKVVQSMISAKTVEIKNA